MRNNQANDQELPPPAGPKIVRSAQLNFIPGNFGTIRTDIERVLRAYKGYIAQLTINTPTGQARWLQATLQVPAGQLDAALGDLRKLGRVTNESQRAEEVTSRYIDVAARLANARNTEQRLLDILRKRTGKLSDVLAAEEQIGRVRQQIEVTEAEQKNLANQIALASIQIRANEDYLQPLRTEDGALINLRNASVQGIHNAISGILAVLLWLLSMGPSLLLITALLFFPVRWVWRRSRRHTLG